MEEIRWEGEISEYNFMCTRIWESMAGEVGKKEDDM